MLGHSRSLLIAAAIAVLMALSAAGAWQWQANAYGRQIADMRRDQADANALAQAGARREEQRRQTALDEVRQDAQDKITTAAADATAADATADSLRADLARIKRRAAGNTCTAAGGTATESATGLLADLLGEVEAAGRAMAAEADRRGIAGAACERSYDAVKGGG